MRDDESTDETKITITWEPPLNSGTNEVISYAIEMAIVSSEFDFIQVAKDVTNLFWTQLDDIKTGQEFQFRVRARSAVGFSLYSDLISVYAATVPGQPSAPTTAIFDTNKVRISWEPFGDDGGLPILGYRVEIQTILGIYTQDLLDCDALIQEIIDQSFCEVKIRQTLKEAPFALQDGDYVFARIIAINIIGESTPSE